jgi:2-polyprenyl-6-methoxyphenol hydroxylase-like FAD-dependent oxidoreductase
MTYGRPGRQVARFAERDGSSLILFVFTADRLDVTPPDGPGAAKAALRQVFAGMGWEVPHMLAAMDEADEVYFDRVSQIVMPRWSEGRVVLLGDAAACVSLLAGEGSSLAMTEAYVLAGELARARGDMHVAAAAYERRLRPLLEAKQKSARKFAGAFAPRTALGIGFRNFVSRLLAFRPVADYFVGRDLRDDFELPDYGL